MSTPRIGGPVSDNVQVSPSDNNVYSTTAATYDPTNHANLFAAANILTATPVAGFASADGGLSWGMHPFPLPDSPPNRFGFYPGGAFDALGTVYASSESYTVIGGQLSSQLVVSKSFDKGRTWRDTSTVEQPSVNPEKPLIAIDTTASPYRNRLYVAYDTNPGNYAEPVVLAHSDDGLTWTRTQFADFGGDFGASPAIGPNGEVYVVWDDWCDRVGMYCSSSGKILLAKSVDGGNTVGLDPYGNKWDEVAMTNMGFQAAIPNYSNGCANPPIGVDPTPSLDVDRSGGVHNGTLYVVWGDQQPRFGRVHIFFASSSDGGARWSSPVQVDTGNLNDAWQPALSVDQANGAVTIAWYDRRDDPGNRFYRPYYTQSTDGGATFLRAQVAVATTASDPTLDCLGTGDYMQMASTDGVAHPFWSDTRNGRNQIFTASVDEATLAQTLSQPPPLFGRPTQLSSSRWPGDLAIGDFNGDGKTDLAVLSANVSIFLGKGDGSFGAPTNAPGGGGIAIAAGDLNKDGKLDLVVSGSNGTSPQVADVKVLLGKGDGTFQAPVSYPAGAGCISGGLTVADFGNGSPDVAVVSRGCYPTPDSVAVLLGKGDGTLAPAITYLVGTGAASVAVGDFRHNGKLDLAVTNVNSGTVSVLFGNGDGTFQGAVSYSAGIGPHGIAVGDFNGDGKPDIAVTNQQNQQNTVFSVLLNKGDGTFLAPVPYGSANSAGGSIASGDFDLDGKLDLAVTAEGIPTMWLGKGDGTFTAAGKYYAGVSSYRILAADLNSDLHPDLIVANQYSDVGILLGATRSAQVQPTTVSFPDQVTKTMGPVRSVTVSNDGTADLELAMANVRGPNARDFAKVGDTCSGAAVPAGGTCTVSLRFAPTAVGSRVASLQVTDDAAGSPQLVPLSGTGLLRNPAPLPAGPVSNRDLPPPPPPSAPTLPSPRGGGELQLPTPRGGGELQPLPTLGVGGELQPVRLFRLLLL